MVGWFHKYHDIFLSIKGLQFQRRHFSKNVYSWLCRRILVGLYLDDHCRVKLTLLILIFLICDFISLFSSVTSSRCFHFSLCRYGDTTAKSVPARIFAVIWILTGLCLYSILISDLSSALSATVSVSKTVLYGAKVERELCVFSNYYTIFSFKTDIIFSFLGVMLDNSVFSKQFILEVE